MIGLLIGGSRLGLLSAALLSISGVHIKYSQDARTYSFVTFLLTTALMALIYLIKESNLVDRSIFFGHFKRVQDFSRLTFLDNPSILLIPLAFFGYALSVVAALHAHYTAVFFPVLTTGFLFIYALPMIFTSRKFVANWLVVHVFILLACSWVLMRLGENTANHGLGWIPQMSWGYFWEEIRKVYIGRSFILWPWIDVVVCGLTISGIIYLRKNVASLAVLVTIFAGLPLLVAAASLERPVFISRVLLWGTIPGFVFAAAGALSLKPRWIRLIAIALALAAQFITLLAYIRSPDDEPWNNVVGFVKENEKPGDVLVFEDEYADPAFRYYYRPEVSLLQSYGLVSGPRRDANRLRQANSQVIELPRDDLPDFVKSHDRIWYVSQWRKGHPFKEIARMVDCKKFRTYGPTAPGKISVCLMVPE